MVALHACDGIGLQPGMAWDCSLGWHRVAAWVASGCSAALQALSPCGSRLPAGLQPLVCRHATQLIGCATAAAAALASASAASAAG